MSLNSLVVLGAGLILSWLLFSDGYLHHSRRKRYAMSWKCNRYCLYTSLSNIIGLLALNHLTLLTQNCNEFHRYIIVICNFSKIETNDYHFSVLSINC